MQDSRMETFLAVCEYQNFTHAADALGLTQPAVSRQMKSLEEHYGVSLFHFEGKKMSLTRAGATLYRYARTVRNDEQRLLQKLKEPVPGILRLGSTPTPGEFMLPKILSSYLREYPHSRVHMEIHNTETLLEQLDHNKIDLAVVEGNFPKKEYAHLLFTVQNYVPICAADQEVSGRSVEDLLPFTLILREPGSGNREILEYSLKRHNILLTDFAGIIETNDPKVQKALVQQGLGIAFLFEAAVKTEKGLRILPVDGFPLQHEMNLIWRKDSVYDEEYLALARSFAEKMS